MELTQDDKNLFFLFSLSSCGAYTTSLNCRMTKLGYHVSEIQIIGAMNWIFKGSSIIGCWGR